MTNTSHTSSMRSPFVSTIYKNKHHVFVKEREMILMPELNLKGCAVMFAALEVWCPVVLMADVSVHMVLWAL